VKSVAKATMGSSRLAPKRVSPYASSCGFLLFAIAMDRRCTRFDGVFIYI
jgi:hypothetical protein